MVDLLLEAIGLRAFVRAVCALVDEDEQLPAQVLRPLRAETVRRAIPLSFELLLPKAVVDLGVERWADTRDVRTVNKNIGLLDDRRIVLPP
jgi:hypothetical protein